MEIRMRPETGPGLFSDNDAIAVPYFVCDYCGKDVKEVGLALFTYDPISTDGRPYSHIQVYHKGACDQRANGNKDKPWDELSSLVAYLVRNHTPYLEGA